MKQRKAFVSNSSSSSFLMPMDVSSIGVNCIMLSDEIVRCFRKYLTDFEGKNVDLSASDHWWLTELIADCDSHYEELCEKGGIEYLAGNEYPYGWYDEGGEKRYVLLRGGDEYNEFFVAIGDLIGKEQQGQVPNGIRAKFVVEKILRSKVLNKTQKLSAIEHYFETM